MIKPLWSFERMPEMGGATGEAYTNPLLGTGMEPAAVLAREALQNSVDAQVKGEKVSVDLRRVTLVGKAKSAFVAEMGLTAALTPRRKCLKLPRETCVDTLSDPKVPLNVLFIEDYGTCGLHGAPFRSKSHFFRLLLSLGDGAKAREAEGSGGSYGFGKSVYSSNSRIHSIVAYSVFDPALSGTPENNHARLMGCGYFNAHDFEGNDFSGRAWFGQSKENGAAQPLVDASAHTLAEKLGFNVRNKAARGTSLLLIDCDVECDMLRSSIEEWWWPRLLDDELGLDIDLYEQDKRLPPPRPRKREDLRPFIECYELAVGRSMPVGLHQKTGSLNKLRETMLGNYGYAVIGEDKETEEKLRDKLGRIALIRKPRMVIEYLSVGGALPLPCVGTFVAAVDVDDALKRSEPASHDKWDAKSSRLDELVPESREAVFAILQRLKIGLRKFANEAMPKAAKQDLRLKSLEKLLGGLFRPPTSSSGGTGGTPGDPLTINFVEKPHVVPVQDSISTAGTFRVALAEDANREKVKIAVRVRCLVQEDDGVSKEDPIPVVVQSDEISGLVAATTDGGIVFELKGKANPLFTFKSNPYARDWTTVVQVDIEEV